MRFSYLTTRLVTGLGLSVAVGLGGPGGLRAQTVGAIAGVVLDSAGTPIPSARVRLIELHRTWRTHEDGTFTFPRVPTGEHVLTVEAVGYRPHEERVRVTSNGSAEVQVRMARLLIELPPLVVTGTIGQRAGEDVLSPISVVAGAALDRTLDGTIAATVRSEPGVALTTLGPVTGRPIIRGLGGDRILVLEDGLRPGDLSSMSSDHAVAVEAVTAEQFEVVRGPMSLLYGSSALGGVVNVIREEIPTSLPAHTHGSLSVQGTSVNRGVTGAAHATALIGPLVWRAEGSARTAGDVSTPVGRLVNTGVTTFNAAVGAGYVRPWGHLGASYRFYDNAYGIPGGFVGGHPGGVDIEMRRQMLRAETDLHDLGGGHASLRVTGQFTDYGHRELESSGAVGTRFDQQLAATEAVLRHQRLGPFWTGAMGVRAQFRDIRTGGSLRMPSTYDFNAALFAVEEMVRGLWSMQLGARVDWAHYVPRDTTAFVSAGGQRIPARPRTFGSVSGSFGLLLAASKAMRLGASVARAFRTPDLTELFSNGPHLADNTFLVGDPALDPETGVGADAFVRISGARVRAEVAAFRNYLTDYIFPSSRGRAELGAQGGRPRFQHTNEDARFEGAEGELQWLPVKHLVLDGTVSYVRARFTSVRDSIPVFSETDTTFVAPSEFPPLIPPLNGRAGIRYDRQTFSLGAGVRFAASQNRLGDFETPTDGYVLFDMSTAVRMLLGGWFHTVTIRADNLLDREYRDHLSRLKEIMPEPGRNVSLLYRVEF
jgi:iron complex outermembrane receptor protein